MKDCKHELKDLVGMADGIHCTACGAVFSALPIAEDDSKPAEKEAPKKEVKKNARRR